MLIIQTLQSIGSVIASERFLYVVLAIVIVCIVALISTSLLLIVRIYELHEAVDQAAAAAPQPIAAQKKQIETHVLWDRIRDRLLGTDHDQWRLAIIEADILMDRSFASLGYQGETVSDKLKQLTSQQLPSIQDAWNAHKVRNRVAHDGAVSLTQPEVRMVLRSYQAVFEDLGVIPR